MNRMTDERLAELCAVAIPSPSAVPYDLASELLQALKAEREYWSQHICAEADNERRIEELRARNAALLTEYGAIEASLKEADKLADELQAENERLQSYRDSMGERTDKWSEEYHDLKARAEAAERKLARVQGLPGKWRQMANETIGLFADPDKHQAIFDCADELEALLKEE